MDKTNVFIAISECINDIVPCAGIGIDERLKEDIGLDSLSLVSVIVGIEDKLGILFEDSDLDPSELITVQNLTDLVMKYV